MANIKGINIEIGANTSKLTDALKNANNVIQASNKDIKELNKALKFDPKNTETLALKQKLLKDNIEATTERLEKLKTAQKQMGDYSSLTEEQKEKYKNLSIEIAKSESALNKMNKELEDTEKADTSKLTNEIDDVGKTAIKVGDIIKANLASEAIVRIFDNIAGKVKNVASSIGNMIVQGGMDRALNLENAKAKMSTFTKSTEQLDKIMQNVSDSVDGTAFSMDSAATVAAGLFAAGIKEGPQMEKSLKLVGDAAQVSGRSMEEIGAIFNKVAANGKITGQELNQLSDSGIPVLQMLSDSTGKSVEEVRKLVSAGKIGFAEFSNAMEKGLGGAAQKSGETFTSSLANLKSALSRIGASLMTPLLEGVTPVMNTFKDMFKLMAKGSAEGIDELANQLGEQINGLAGNILEQIGPFLEKMLPVLGKVLGKILETLPEALSDVADMVMYYLLELGGIIVDNLPQIVNSILSALEGMMFGIADQLPTLIPRIVESIVGIATVLVDNIDTFISAGMSLLGGLLQGLLQALPMLINKIPELITNLVDALVKNLPILIDGALELVMQIVYALPTIITALVQALPTVITAVVDGLLSALPILVEGAITLVVELVKALPIIIVELIKAIPSILKSIATAIISHASTIVKVGVDLIKALWQGWKSWMSTLYGNIFSFAKSIPQRIVSGIGKISDIGKNLVKGIWNGINNAKDWVLEKIKGFGKAIVDGIKSIFKIHSPSQIMRDEIGKNLALGIGVGFEDEMKNVARDMEMSAKQLTYGINNSLNPFINPNALNINTPISAETQSGEGFTAIINNNSKYTTPSDNVRLLRQQYELYKLKYGRSRG